MLKAMVDTEKIDKLSWESEYRTVHKLERKLRLKDDEIIRWRLKIPEAQKLFKVADALSVDISELLIVYDTDDKDTIVLHRPKDPNDRWSIKQSDKSVYIITCEKSGRSYIGSSIDAEKRIRNHLIPLSKHKHTNIEMQRDFDEYGADSFEGRVLGTFSYLTGSYLEYLFMYYYGTRNKETGYNYNDNHGNSYKDVCLKDIEMLKERSKEKSMTIEELLSQSRVVLETVRPKTKRRSRCSMTKSKS